MKGFSTKGQIPLYLIWFSILSLLHYLLISRGKSLSPPPPMRIKMAGSPKSLSSQGVLKMLRVSESTTLKSNFVEKTSRKKEAPPKSPQAPSQKTYKLSDLGYRAIPQAPSIKYQNKNILRFIQENQLFRSLNNQVQELDLRNLNSGVQIEMPKGYPLDKLNSLERKFYSFQLRVYKAYIYSLLNQAYHRQTPSYPFPFIKKPTRLMAKVHFDQDGNLLRIQTLKMGDNKDLQDVFTAALDDIRVLPNPPREILDKNGEFAIHFILQIY